MDQINYAFDSENLREITFSFKPGLKNIATAIVRITKNQLQFDLEVDGVFDGDDLSRFNDFF